MPRKYLILGGGTFSPVACHLSLAAPAFGTTARYLRDRYVENNISTKLVLTKMADHRSDIVTTDDLIARIPDLIKDPELHAVIFNVAVCDFEMKNPSKEARLSSKMTYPTHLIGVEQKIITSIRESRKDIFLVGFKTTSGATVDEQLDKGWKLLKDSHLDLVLCNDVGTYNNILLTAIGQEFYGSREEMLDLILKYSIEGLH